jgi:outer membrane protein
MRYIISGITLFLIGLSSFNAKADNSLQLSAGLSFWNSAPDGSFGQTEDSVLVLNKESAYQHSYYFTIEHNFRFVPHIKISKTVTSNDSTSTIDQTFILSDTIFRVASNLDVKSDYEQLDVITYFEVFDNRTFELDLGLTFRNHSIHTQITNQDENSEWDSKDVSDLQLLGFVAGRVNLPLLRTGAFFEASILDKDNYDYQVGVSYDISVTKSAKTYLQLGMKSQTIEFSNLDGLYTQVDWQAFFIGAGLRF